MGPCAGAQVYTRAFWTETFVAWSPHGSYLATMHRQGAAIWGGPSFSRLQRFSHPNVRAARGPTDAACLPQRCCISVLRSGVPRSAMCSDGTCIYWHFVCVVACMMLFSLDSRLSRNVRPWWGRPIHARQPVRQDLCCQVYMCSCGCG